MTQTVAPLSHDDAAHTPRGSAWWVIALVLVAAAGLIGAWWWVTAPRLDGAGFSGVWSEDHPIVEVSGLDESLYIVPATAGETMLAFGLHNLGRLPARLIEVWPDQPAGCIWTASAREVRTDPRLMYAREGPARAPQEVTIPPGQAVTVWLTGAHPDVEHCVHEGMTSVDHVTVTTSIGGRRSTTDVPLGYRFGWSDDPVGFAEPFGVSVREPSPVPPRGP